MRTDLDRLFEDFLGDTGREFFAPFTTNEWAPALDFEEGDKELTLRVEVPGVDPKDIDISVSGDVLTISGEKKLEKEKGKGKARRTECYYGSFQRSVPLPTSADPAKIEAEYAKGVLTIHVGKAEGEEPKKVAVSVK
jgi:HSP20 family protein